MSNENWLAAVDASKYLHQVVIPGSHDAGVYRDVMTARDVSVTLKDVSVKTPLVSASRVRCQGMSILNQAVAGSRFFDCRVYLRSFPLAKYVDGKKTKEQTVPTLGHFFKDTTGGMGGGYGGSLETVINDALAFVRDHPTEFIILRFSHTQCTEHVADLLEQIYDRHGNDQFIFTGDVNIAQCRIRDLRGKVIMVFDSKFNKQRQQTYQVKKTLQRLRSVEYKQGRGLSAKGMHLFTKFGKGGAIGNGLCTCGEFASSEKITNVYKKSMDAVKEHRDHGGNDHLCFVYWQLTGGNVEANTKAETGPHARLQDFLYEVLSAVVNQLPNVISHDFVSAETCKTIIRLNTERREMMAEALAKTVNRR